VPAEDAAVLADELLGRLHAMASPEDAAGMARFGISPVGTLGVSMGPLRGIVGELRPLRRRDPELVHEVAGHLWASGIHEARILAGLVDVPALVTREQADAWVADLDSWDTCDQLQHLMAATTFACAAVGDWIGREEMFVRRAGLVLLCTLAVHDKRAPDERITAFLPAVEGVAHDERTYVSKAVSWALRQVGKRSAACHGAAVESAERILAATPARPADAGGRAARWAANDALRELRSDAVRTRLGLA
jgi:3-methyladenine DNA glycosylase AlkD